MNLRSVGKRAAWILVAVMAATLLGAAFSVRSQASGTNLGPGNKDLAELVKGNNAFAFELYAKLKTNPGNIVFSPYSISTALAMTWAGARGDTEKQMAEVLHFPEGQDQLHAAMAQLTDGLNQRGGSGKYELVVANRLWGQKGLDFLPSFTGLVKKYYGAGLEAVDFAADPEKARAIINAWAEEQTRGKIKEPVPQGAITPATLLALANAIYFKGKWASQFDKANTNDEPFMLTADEKVDVPMMYQKMEVKLIGKEGTQFIAMPYAGDELSMIVILPKTVDGLTSLENWLSPERLDGVLARSHKLEVQVYLPRFKLDFGAELSDVLQSMGMTDAFGGAADFSGMTGSRGLSISKVIHQAMIDVNEEGTEAAAVTVVLMTKSAPMPPPVFRADHPFIFLIRDNQTGSILFMGRVMDPRG